MNDVETIKITECHQHKIEPLLLMRYVKPSYIKDGEPTDDVFQLREDREPPEEYVSFYHSTGETLNIRINFIKKTMRNFNFSNNSGFIQLNASEACKAINTVREIISFKEEGYSHYGMYFMSEDETDIIEAKTLLLFSSTLHLEKDLVKAELIGTNNNYLTS